MKISFLRLFSMIAVLALGFVTATAHAQDLGAVKARMAERIAKVDELKAKGAIGENNRGLLEVRAADAEAGAVVGAENSDRETVYAALAKQTGSSADQVGRARAKQIAANSAAGVWLQKEDGAWYKK
ncbi:MAG TPA: DUF1318 domain-containing protein [Opitutaceae bacterium]|nr:DUF1318 domain-containing protein [Opitutaceae bacterium]